MELNGLDLRVPALNPVDLPHRFLFVMKGDDGRKGTLEGLGD